MEAVAIPSTLTLSSVLWATLGLGGFIGGLFLATMILPGKVHRGLPTPAGERRYYKLNGMALWVLTHMVVIGATLTLGLSLSPLVTTWFWPLLVAANLISIAASLWLYLGGKRRQAAAGESRPAGESAIAEFWYGAELNPTLAGVDLKIFAYQPSLIGLHVLVAAFAYAQYESLGTLTPQMVLYQAFWWLYLYTHYRDEPGLTSMWDVIAERFGFMLVWGDLTLVPFFYCIAGWTLMGQSAPISSAEGIALSALFLFGLWVFRGANKQKHLFKLDRSTPIWGRTPEVLGDRLLISGFWGIGRKLNYSGELCVYLAIAATAGRGSLEPYLVFLWLLSLLLHRAWRDDKRCRARYGALWEEYCARARFKMIPFIY
ncbi:MAG: hypothetical protein KC420_16040 [Myxococcales bacterium]|nr:hypothetical protein [Myxococcales bacterium]